MQIDSIQKDVTLRQLRIPSVIDKPQISIYVTIIANMFEQLKKFQLKL